MISSRKNLISKFSILLMLLVVFCGYTGLVYTKGTETSSRNPSLSSSAVEGKILWQTHNCSSCHQLYGLGGYLGPDLTTVISRKGELYAKAIILSGTRRMPFYGLKESEAEAITKFLLYVDSTAYSYKAARNKIATD